MENLLLLGVPIFKHIMVNYLLLAHHLLHPSFSQYSWSDPATGSLASFIALYREGIIFNQRFLLLGKRSCFTESDAILLVISR